MKVDEIMKELTERVEKASAEMLLVKAFGKKIYSVDITKNTLRLEVKSRIDGYQDTYVVYVKSWEMLCSSGEDSLLLEICCPPDVSYFILYDPTLDMWLDKHGEAEVILT